MKYPTGTVRIQYTSASMRFQGERNVAAAGPRNEERFNKKQFQITKKTATILRKENPAIYPPAMATACKHPRVRVVSRHEDTEFVECLECGEVFDSEEFRDMEIEEIAEKEDVPGDS